MSKNNMSNNVNEENKCHQTTPLTNRGVEITQKMPVYLETTGETRCELNYLLFDWFQATILSESFDISFDTGEVLAVNEVGERVIEIFNYLFGLAYTDLVYEYYGVNGYNVSYSYKNIYIMYNTSRPDMGIHILMSGQACRDFEQLGLDYIEFFQKLEDKYILNYNRIDISIDSFTDKYFTLQKLLDKVRVGELSSKFMNVLNLEKIHLDSSKNQGHTLQFGSKASNIQITFYDKLKERESKNIIVDKNIKFWTRTEVRFRHEHARSVVKKILAKEQTVNELIRSVLYHYLDFKIPKKQWKDNNITRVATVGWWRNFLKNVTTLSITNYLPEEGITRKKEWLYKSTSKSALMVLLSSLDNLKLDTQSSNFLVELFQKGSNKFNYKDLSRVNDFRKVNKLEPLTFSEVKNYIDDLHSIILSNENKATNQLLNSDTLLPIIDIMLTKRWKEI